MDLMNECYSITVDDNNNIWVCYFGEDSLPMISN